MRTRPRRRSLLQDWTPRVLTARQNDAVVALTELIIPDTGRARHARREGRAREPLRRLRFCTTPRPPIARPSSAASPGSTRAARRSSARTFSPRAPRIRRRSSRASRTTATRTARMPDRHRVLPGDQSHDDQRLLHVGDRPPAGARRRRAAVPAAVPGVHAPGAPVMKTLLLVLVSAVSLAGVQQPPATPYAPKQSDRPEAVSGDEPGFQPIFDGKTLSGWEGDPTYWRVENGSLVGEITPATVIKSNTFIIWRGGRPKDFELKLDYRITPDGQQRHQLPQRRGARSGDARQQVRDARLSVRSRRPEAISRQQLRGEGPAVPGRARTGHPRRRRTAAGARVDDRRSGRARAGRDRRLERRPPDRSRQHADPHRSTAAS